LTIFWERFQMTAFGRCNTRPLACDSINESSSTGVGPSIATAP
jgi:hypothetical protein